MLVAQLLLHEQGVEPSLKQMRGIRPPERVDINARAELKIVTVPPEAHHSDTQTASGR
jgi:hypothetical protein